MQWLIDLVLETFKGMILMWSGAIVDIPSGWALCDGTQGTPDLRDRFIAGAGILHDVGDTGGANTHDHDFTGDGHNHQPPGELGVLIGEEASAWPDIPPGTSVDPATGTTDSAEGLPPYYGLAYIMKL